MEKDLRNIELLSYQFLLEKLVLGKSHLLLGNGFNFSLGINTSYKEIFSRMKELLPDYKQLDEEFQNANCDIELVIGNLQNSIKTENKFKGFLNNFIHNKVKADFMKATVSIVMENIKNIYQENNEGIYLLLSKFQNYFSINYDPFLYLLLMKLKKKDNQAIVFPNSIKFFEKELKNEDSKLFKLIDTAYQEAKLTINFQDKTINRTLKNITKSDFNNQVKKIIKNQYPNTKDKEIKRITKIYFENLRQDHRTLDINDGFQGELFNEDFKNSLQNVFFIHGAFHIYQNGKNIKKITQTSDKALYQNIDEIIDAEDKDIVCILKPDNKFEDIEQNNYLKNSLYKLSEIEGELVIFGSALSENDNHIFNKINDNMQITTVYLSTCPENLQSTSIRALEVFPNKEIGYFDYKTVSYVNIEEIENKVIDE
jgi:hypothetical protein